MWGGIDDLLFIIICWKIVFFYLYFVLIMEIFIIGVYDICIIKYFFNLVVMIIIYKFVFLISVINLFNINFFMKICNVRKICKIFLFCYKV